MGCICLLESSDTRNVLKRKSKVKRFYIFFFTPYPFFMQLKADTNMYVYEGELPPQM